MRLDKKLNQFSRVALAALSLMWYGKAMGLPPLRPLNAKDTPADATYEDAAHGFKMLASPKWVKGSPANKIVMLSLAYESRSVRGQTIPKVIVIVNDTKNFADTSLDGEVERLRKDSGKNAPDLEISDNEATTLDGVKAVTYTLTKKVNGLNTKYHYVVAVHGGRLCLVIYMADPKVYDELEPEARKVIESFKWTP